MSCLPQWSDAPSTDEPDGPLMAVLEQYLGELERGGLPDPEQVIASHPELADQLRSYLSSLNFLQRAADGLKPKNRAEQRALAPVGPSRQLGDYRIVREVARGGMGVVYEAEQISLGRRVALKVLPMAAVLDGRQLQRFRNEAQAAAALHHPNIVPVHGIGCEQGIHYYAMQYIEGQTLAEMIVRLQQADDPAANSAPDSALDSAPDSGDSPPAGLRAESGAASSPSPEFVSGAATGSLVDVSTRRDGQPADYFRHVAGLVIQVAEALDYAHLQGVLHRDIKPSNLILDAGGRVWVTDFGLARVETNPALTLSGDLVGTLRYMSPEQLLARRGVVDHRSDVYSLGATFYELLTLQPAFGDMERQELLRRVTFEEPAAPRKICKAIPLDLETIVLKAMAKSVGERYATAQALADDLRQFLDNRPIKARRPNLVQRLSKWSQRHRPVVVTAVLTTILGLASSTFVLLYQQHYLSSARQQAEANYLLARQAASRERQQRAKADRERMRAEDNLQKAFDAVDAMLMEVATKDLADVPQMDSVRRHLLDKALVFYQELLRQKGRDRSVRTEVARAHQRAGQVLRLLGRNEEAKQSMEAAVGLFGELSYEDPLLLHEVARSLSALGRLQWESGDYLLAKAALQEALRQQSRVVQRHEDMPGYRFTKAAITMNLATLSMETGDVADGEATFLQALEMHRSLAEEFPEELEYQDQLADNYLNLGVLYRNTGRPQEAEDALRRALEVGQQLARKHPDNPRLEASLALSHNNLGALLWNQERKSDAEQHWRQAIETQEKLVQQHPDVPQYQANLAASYHNLAVLYKETRGCEESLELFHRAMAARRKLVRNFPWFTRYRRELALGLSSLGDVYLEMTRFNDARQAFSEAWQTQQSLASKHPEILDFAVDLAGSCVSQGHLALQLDDYPAALDFYQEAQKISNEVLTKRPHDYRALRYLKAAQTGCEELREQHWDQMSVKA